MKLIEMRERGLTYREIASVAKINVKTVFRAVNRRKDMRERATK